MRVVVVGLGAVGARAARQLASCPSVDDLALVDAHEKRADAVARSLGPPARMLNLVAGNLPEGTEVTVLALPDDHRQLAVAALAAGSDVVSVADSVSCVRRLLNLDLEARERGRHVVVGAGFSPGLSCVLARHASAGFDTVDEIHVAKVGTGGPACARRHHQALAGLVIDWRDGAWSRRRGGSGRELRWFPDPIGGVDCYRAALPDALLLVPAFPTVQRVTARMGANRRDRFTAHLPMLRPPHPEGQAGGIQVEVRGSRGAAREVRVLGAMDRPAAAAGAVAAQAAQWANSGRLRRVGAAGLAELVDPIPFLRGLARLGVKAAVFEGGDVTT